MGTTSSPAEQSENRRRKLRFGAFVLDLDRASLWKGAEELKLRPKSFDVLRFLAEHPQRIVTKAELMSAVWADAFVTDNVLLQSLFEIRRALDDESQDLVKTVARRGYIFDAHVTGEGSQDTPDRLVRIQSDLQAPKRIISESPRLGWRNAAGLAALLIAVITLGSTWVGRRWFAPPSSVHSIAVLPLSSLSHDLDQELFADGMTEALITDLGKINSLRLISHTSVNHYKGSKLPIPEIAKALQVDAIVEGTVMWSGGRSRVTGNLIQAHPEKHLWAEAYERDLRDVLTMQDEIARSIAYEVQAKSLPGNVARPVLVNPEAYQEYLWGYRLFEGFTWDGEHNALRHLDRAIRLDPNFAPAYATRAEVYIPLVSWGAIPPRESLAKAEEDARKALSLDDTMADAHIGMAAVHVMRTEWSEAEREFQRALALNPNHYIAHDWHGYLLGDIGNHDGEMAEIKLSCRLDPVTEFPHKSLGAVYLETGRYTEAIAEAQKALELSPAFGVARWVLARAYEAQKDYLEAIAEFGKLGDSVDQAHAYAISGNKGKARAILRNLQHQAKTQYISHTGLALVLLGLEDNNKAIAELEKADQNGEPFDYMNQDSRFNPLRANPSLRHAAPRTRANSIKFDLWIRAL
jgi:TolB-like protein/DNA-binding winged helix-turn-helix (wHTH) protein/Flp pilus assembly protein TadD